MSHCERSSTVEQGDQTCNGSRLHNAHGDLLDHSSLLPGGFTLLLKIDRLLPSHSEQSWNLSRKESSVG